MLSLSAPFRLGLWAAGGGSVDAQEAADAVRLGGPGNAAMWRPTRDATSRFIGRNGSGGNAAAGSVSGLVLDKIATQGRSAKAYRPDTPELIPNPDFAAATGWGTQLDGIAISDSKARFNNAQHLAGIFRTHSDFAVGGVFAVEIVIDSITSGGVAVSVGDQGNHNNSAANYIFSAAGTYNIIVANFTPADDNYFRVLASVAGTTADVSRVSVKRIPGAHMIAPSDGARPTVQASGAVKGSGLDDYMVASWVHSGAQVYFIGAVEVVVEDGNYPRIFSADKASNVDGAIIANHLGDNDTNTVGSYRPGVHFRTTEDLALNRKCVVEIARGAVEFIAVDGAQQNFPAGNTVDLDRVSMLADPTGGFPGPFPLFGLGVSKAVPSDADRALLRTSFGRDAGLTL